MTMPGLWLFGSADDKTPVEESVAILDRVKSEGHNVTVQVFPSAGHGLLDVPPAAPRHQSRSSTGLHSGWPDKSATPHPVVRLRTLSCRCEV
jgi:dienelactone hydrolase